ncbi:MAG: hypothetical protein ACI8RZ_003574 [Myxococcota bacterium]|jgi:hypothetical protein
MGLSMILAVMTMRPAAACSCARPPPARTLVPGSVADVLSTDGAVWVYFSGIWSDAWRRLEAEQYRIRDPDGLTVPVASSLTRTVLTLRPIQPLSPDTRYTVQRAVLHRDGLPLSDSQVWSLLTSPEATMAGLRRHWVTQAHIQVGSGPESRSSVALALASANLATAQGGGDCGPGESIWADLTLPDTLLPTDQLSLEVAGQGVGWRYPYRPPRVPGGNSLPSRAQISDMYCSSAPVHVALTRTPRVRLRAESAGGVLLATSPWVEVVPDARNGIPMTPPPEHDSWQSARWPGMLDAVANLARAPLSENVVVGSGMPSCPKGLTTTGHEVRSGHVWPQREPGLLTMDAERVWLLGSGEARELRTWSGEGVSGGQLPERGTISVGAAGLLLIEWTPEDVLDVRLRDGDGEERWKTRLDELGREQWLIFSAVGPTEVLLGWGWWGVGMTRQEQWTLLDAATGARIAQGELAEMAPEGRHVDDVVWDGEQFVLSWRWRRPDPSREVAPALVDLPEGDYLSRLSPDGRWLATTPLPTPLSRGVALLAEQEGLVVVSVDSEDMLLGRLDGDGELISTPARLNAGVLSGGRVSMARTGDGLAVAWDSADGSFVTLVDDAGNTTPPHHLGGGYSVRNVAVRGGESLSVIYGSSGIQRDEWIAVVESLACTD